MLCDDLEGWDGGRGGRVGRETREGGDFCCCMAETNTTL